MRQRGRDRSDRENFLSDARRVGAGGPVGPLGNWPSLRRSVGPAIEPVTPVGPEPVTPVGPRTSCCVWFMSWLVWSRSSPCGTH